MTEITMSVAIATAATLAALFLLALRLQIQGRRPVLDLTQRWAASSTRTSSVALVLLCALAAFSMQHTVAIEAVATGSETAARRLAIHSSSHAPARDNHRDPATAQALASLQSYADTLDGSSESIAPKSTAPVAASTDPLPEVDTMIAKLVARLEKQPDDVKGWKMLGWSYLNTGKPVDAASAYERALKLDSRDAEISKGLEEARTAQALLGSSPASTPTASSNADGNNADKSNAAGGR